MQTLDQQIDYSDYDRWTFTPYNYNGHHEDPDGIVDLIIMYYRRINTFFSFQAGIASLGLFESPDLMLDGEIIKFGFPSSGLTNNGGSFGTSLFSVKHEIGHFLFGSGHPSHGENPCGYANHYAFWGIMTSNPHLCVTAYERERLAWIDYHDIDDDGITTAALADFVTTGIAYRIVIPGANSAFILENHQKVLTGAAAAFDDPNYIWPGKGLFIYRVDGLDANHPHYSLMSADGNFTWSNPYWIDNPYGANPDSLPVYRKASPNRNGRDGRDYISHTKPSVEGGCFRIFALDLDGQHAWLHERLWGDEKDAFNIGFNQVFSPWSNPNSKKLDDSVADIGVEITGKSIGVNGEDIFNVTFYYGSGYPIQASPSKPQDLRATVYQPNPWVRILRLTWAPNLEDDVINGGSFQIYRRIRDHRVYPITWTAWSYLTAVPGSQTQYDDNSIAGAGTGTDSVQYYIQAKDNTNKTSVPSDFAAINFTAGVEKNGNPEGGPTPPTVFMLVQNYPNPFNPSTILKYQLAEDGFVSLKVFDVLGKEVATLVNQQQAAGYYSTTFGGQDVSSGVYFARFVVTGAAGEVKYSKMTKLVLMK